MSLKAMPVLLSAVLAASFAIACSAAAPGTGPAGGALDPPPAAVPEDDRSAMIGNRWLVSLSDEELRNVTNEDLVKWFPPDLGCPDGQPKRGGTYNFGTNWDPPHLDPTFTESGGLMKISTVNYDTLLEIVTGCRFDYRKLQLEPGLAESWTLSPDGLTYTFKIRKGVKYVNAAPLNGRELTAEDVKWTYEHYMTTPGSLQKADLAASRGSRRLTPRPSRSR